MARTLYTGISTAAGSVTVVYTGTSTKAPVYPYYTGSAETPQPVTADYDGGYRFYVPDGTYDILNGSSTGSLTNVKILSYTEGQPNADNISFTPCQNITSVNVTAAIKEVTAMAQAALASLALQNGGALASSPVNSDRPESNINSIYALGYSPSANMYASRSFV